MPAFDSDAALQKLLDAGLQIGTAKLAPAVVPNNAVARPTTDETPGKPAPNGQKQIDEAEKDPLRRYGPIVAAVVGAVVVLAIIFKR